MSRPATKFPSQLAVASFAVVLVAACAYVAHAATSGSNVIVRAGAQRGVAVINGLDNANGAALFVRDGARSISIFDATYKKIGTIFGPTGEMATDQAGDLFVVPELSNNNEVLRYEPPYTSAPSIITVGAFIAFGMGVDPVTGLLAVLTRSGFSGGQSHVLFFKRGQSSACNVLHPQIPNGIGTHGVFDAEGNLFVEGGNSSHLYVFAGGCKATSFEQLSFTTKGVSVDGYFAINKDDNFVIESYEGHEAPIYTFSHPLNGVFGKPLLRTELQDLHRPGYGRIPPQMLCMTADGTHLYAINVNPNLVALYLYPQGGKPVMRFSIPPGTLTVIPPIIP